MIDSLKWPVASSDWPHAVQPSTSNQSRCIDRKTAGKNPGGVHIKSQQQDFAPLGLKHLELVGMGYSQSKDIAVAAATDKLHSKVKGVDITLV